MRLSEKEIRERFAKLLKLGPLSVRDLAELGEDVVYVREDEALEAFLKLAADLQAPPTGEEVERLHLECAGKAGVLSKASASRSLGLCEMIDLDAAIVAYGSACARAGAAEAKRRETETESAARCRVNNAMLNVLNGGGVAADTAYQYALEAFGDACREQGAAEAGKARHKDCVVKLSAQSETPTCFYLRDGTKVRIARHFDCKGSAWLENVRQDGIEADQLAANGGKEGA